MERSGIRETVEREMWQRPSLEVNKWVSQRGKAVTAG